MKKAYSLTEGFFDKVILGWPRLVMVCLFVVISFLGYHSKDFSLDASEETLVLEGDEDLRYSRLISSRYDVSEFLFVTYTPKGDLFSDQTLSKLNQLKEDLERLEGVESVLSILNVPLLESPPVPVKELASGFKTLQSPGVDRLLARKEFQNSPISRDLLVSPDLKTTNLLVSLLKDQVYEDIYSRRNHLRDKKNTQGLTDTEADELERIEEQFQRFRDGRRESLHQTILAIRTTMEPYRQDADLFLGGVSMIVDDLISFVKSDLKIFGVGVFCFLVIALGAIFRRVRWIVLPLFCCALSVLCMFGILGLFGWEVTVISSNFVMLQLILTMAIAIHLIVRYRELRIKNPESDNRALILETVRLKLQPCLFAALTTIAGFGSLLFCDIKPVINFGWMMTAGLVVSLVLTFILFPSALMLLRVERPGSPGNSSFSFLPFLSRFTEKHGILILIVSFVTLVLSGIGISKLRVENAFIDYFKKSTEIYQGMKVIDQNLGGTTPLDVIVDLDRPEVEPLIQPVESDGEENEFIDEFDEFEGFDEFEDVSDDEKYWFTEGKMAQVLKIHDYLQGLPEVGKVMSLGMILKIAERLNDGKPLDSFTMALLYEEFPEEYRDLLLKSYVSIEHDQVRFWARIKDSEESLERNMFLKRVEDELVRELGLEKDHVRLSGLLVLYNNMLQSLFSSQILTIGIVVVVLMAMFLILFRSLKVSLIAISPNILSVGVVLGMMGWLDIPLDMMTITIAAISVGIAVDNTIHYIHRFEEEFRVDGNYIQSVHRCHGSIGYAMYYTSITIIVGFSILALSNFVPSIYFGLLTGLAMFIALIAALTLLPQLIIVIKPYGAEKKTTGE